MDVNSLEEGDVWNVEELPPTVDRSGGKEAAEAAPPLPLAPLI